MNVLLRDMVPCPHCGVLLESRLVAAIRDPRELESCPSKPKPVVKPAPVADVVPFRVVEHRIPQRIIDAMREAA